MDDPTTLVLTRAEIAALMTPRDYRQAVEAGFLAAAQGQSATPAPMHIAGADGGGFHVKGAGAQDYVAFKINGNFPANRATHGLPTIQGVVVLCDARDGRVLALMDSIEITLQRTAAATAVAATRLARPASRRIAICGCGDQALPHLRALADVLPLTTGFAWDRDADRTQALAVAAAGLGIALTPTGDLARATDGADVIVTCTTARTPFLGPEHVSPGAFVAAVGADSPDKNELHPRLLRGATVVVDLLSQALAMGDLRHAIAAGVMTPGEVHAELGEVVAGARPGRTGEDEITVFDSTGTAIQDVASAARLFELAREMQAGRSIRLGAMA
jgi:ornithine cyclodeaminase/alanine dehydrogenase-like protein (mu-crystallin family)